MMGGEVTVSSKFGDGSVFTVALLEAEVEEEDRAK